MEGIFINNIIASIGDGNTEKGMFNILVFVVLYLQIRGLKAEVRSIGKTAEHGFKEGETRFSKIEDRLHSLEFKIQP